MHTNPRTSHATPARRGLDGPIAPMKTAFGRALGWPPEVICAFQPSPTKRSNSDLTGLGLGLGLGLESVVSGQWSVVSG